ncbi:MAG: hypothetical protein AAF481_17330 [Acidobacteriota bacterium]
MSDLVFSSVQTVTYGSDNKIELSDSPALATYQGRIFVGFYKAASNSVAYTSSYQVNDTYWSREEPVRNPSTTVTPADDILHFILRWDGENKLYSYEWTKDVWGNEENLSANDGFKSDHQPAFTMYRSKLYMVYKGKDNSKLYWCTYDVNSGWSTEQNITSENDAKSGRPPALVVFQGLLYMVYKGKDTKKLHWCT